MHRTTASEFLQHVRTTALESALIDVGPAGGAMFVALKPTFHLLIEGACSLLTEDGEASAAVHAGDFIVLPRGIRHSLRDGPDVPAWPATHAHRSASPLARDVPAQLAFGTPGHATAFRTLSGVFEFPAQTSRPIVAAMPRLLRLAAVQTGAIHANTAARALAAGGRAYVQRLADLLLLEAVRAEPDLMSRLSLLGATWLRTFGVEHAIAAVSADPAQAWTLASLARHAGMSRASFAAKYQAHVGLPPMRHLAAIRLAHAAQLLRSTVLSVSEVAARSGYESESSFGRAFRRRHGTTPAAYRRQAWVEPIR